MKGRKIITILIIVNLILVGIIYNLINKGNVNNQKQKLKEMTETEYEDYISELNQSHMDYANYIEESKKKIASALTEKGVETSNDDTLETMASNIRNISGVLGNGLFDDFLLLGDSIKCYIYCEVPIILSTAIISGGDCDIYDITTTTNAESQVMHDSNYVNGNSSGSWYEGSTYSKVFKNVTDYGFINYSLKPGNQGTTSTKTFAFANCDQITDLGSENKINISDSYKYVVAIIHEQCAGGSTIIPTITISDVSNVVYQDGALLGTTVSSAGWGIGAYCIKIFKNVSNATLTMTNGNTARRTSYQCYGLN